jgi:hypothetical protein
MQDDQVRADAGHIAPLPAGVTVPVAAMSNLCYIIAQPPATPRTTPTWCRNDSEQQTLYSSWLLNLLTHALFSHSPWPAGWRGDPAAS